MEINTEDYNKIRKFQDIMNHGFYASGQEVTDLHNKVLGTRLASTNCSACIRQRIQALVAAADKFKRVVELEKKQEPTPIKQEENKAVRKPKNKK